MSITSHWQAITHTLQASQTRLLAVSKQTTDEAVQTLWQAGQKDFAESRPQNLRHRATLFPDATWHFIGPLQKNKAKYIARHAAMWHSLDNFDTAKAVAKYLEAGQTLPTLIQVNISGEAQKQGIHPEQLHAFCEQMAQLPQLPIIGLMGMAAQSGDPRPAFQQLRMLRDDLQKKHGTIRQLCMGMSGDWPIAVEEGATMVRLGSTLFSDAPSPPAPSTAQIDSQ